MVNGQSGADGHTVMHPAEKETNPENEAVIRQNRKMGEPIVQVQTT